ncbi:hypothetical protein [Planctomycetes bacterium K23_9]|uniref:Type II secretion system protein GspC N-terminal domain-containing protein n=1 Tax=Stieleria marina TaxID=1930275 RepID=A0A517NNW0_9BACT|nr:hypothetical protein K239x_07570 [Planctomycetes bacterium K23_9]
MDYQRSVLPTALRWGSISLVAVMAGLLAWAAVPIDDVKVETAGRKPATQLPATALSEDWRSADLDALWSRSLQGRRAAAKPVVVVAKSKAKPTPKPQAKVSAPTTLGVRLVGTIIEPGSNLAIASDREGQLSFRSEGQRFQLQPKGVLIESIDDAGVWVRYKGQRIQWAVGENLSWTNAKANAGPTTKDAQPGGSSKSRIIRPQANVPASEMLDDEDGMLDDRTPIRTEEFPKMSLEDELDFLNG